MFLVYFFSKSCHFKTYSDFSMKPTPNGHKYPKFSVKESRANLSQSITEIFKLKEWPHTIQKLNGFKEILVHVNKAVYKHSTCLSSYKVGAWSMIPAVPTNTATVKIQRKSRSSTIATYFQSSITWNHTSIFIDSTLQSGH